MINVSFSRIEISALVLLLTAFTLPGCSDSTKPRSLNSKIQAIQADVFYPENQPRFDFKTANQAKPVLVAFWATWCEACKEELPALNEIAKQHSEKLEVVSINVQEEAEHVKAFLLLNPLNYPVILDESGELSDLFEVTAIPSVVLLAKGGEILYYGFRLPTPGKLEEALGV